MEDNSQVKKLNRISKKEVKSLRYLREKNFRVDKKKGDFKKFRRLRENIRDKEGQVKRTFQK